VRIPALLRDRRLWLALAALVLAVRAGLPLLVERVIESQASQALRLPVRLGDVDFWLVLGGVELEDLRVGRKGSALDLAEIAPEASLFTLRRAYVRLGWLDLLRGRIRLRELALDEPTARVEREPDGRIAPLPEAPPEPQPAPQPAAEEGGAMPLAIDQLALRTAKLMVAHEVKGERDLLTFALEELTLGDFALDEKGISLGAVGIRRPSVRVQRQLALGGPAPAAAPRPAAPAPPTAPAPASARSAKPAQQAQEYRVQRISIERAAFALEMEQSQLDVALGLDAENVTMARDQTFPVRVTLELAGGKIEVDGKTGIDPIVFDGTLRWADLALPPLLAPLSPGPTDWLRAATSRGDLRLAVRLAPLTDAVNSALTVSGTAVLAGVDAGDPRQELGVAWKSLQVDLDETRIPLAPEAGAAKFALRAVVLDEPAFRFTLPATSLAELGGSEAPAEPAAGAPPPAPEPTSPAAAEPSISVASLELRAGRADFIDRSVTPEYTGALRGIAVSARDFRWPERDVKDLRVRWVGPDAATLDVRGALAGGTGEIRLALARLAVPGFNPYATSLAGLEITSGDFNLETRIGARKTTFQTRSQITIHDMGVGSGGSGMVPGVGLPINVVLALLRDPRGDISLSVPVDVDEGGARAGLGSIVLSALRATLIGAVSSPLKALGSVADLGALAVGERAAEPGIPPLEATPGKPELTESAAERLPQLASVLEARPILAFVLRGRAGEPDRLPVAEDLLREAIARDEEPPLPDSSFFQRRRLRSALEERARGETPELSDEDRAALERWIASVTVPRERLLALARSRAETLLARMAAEHGVAATRLPLGEPGEGEPGVTLELTAAAL
jgi:hypothetical protein